MAGRRFDGNGIIEVIPHGLISIPKSVGIPQKMQVFVPTYCWHSSSLFLHRYRMTPPKRTGKGSVPWEAVNQQAFHIQKRRCALPLNLMKPFFWIRSVLLEEESRTSWGISLLSFLLVSRIVFSKRSKSARKPSRVERSNFSSDGKSPKVESDF